MKRLYFSRLEAENELMFFDIRETIKGGLEI